MPIYEYLCQDCSFTFEVKQSMKDEAVAACTRCGKSVSRIISAPAIMFKGKGWYITDYSDKMKPPTGESSDSGKQEKKESKETAASTTPASPTTPVPAAATTPTSAAPSSSGSGTSTSSPASSTPSSGSSSSST